MVDVFSWTVCTSSLRLVVVGPICTSVLSAESTSLLRPGHRGLCSSRLAQEDWSGFPGRDEPWSRHREGVCRGGRTVVSKDLERLLDDDEELRGPLGPVPGVDVVTTVGRVWRVKSDPSKVTVVLAVTWWRSLPYTVGGSRVDSRARSDVPWVVLLVRHRHWFRRTVRHGQSGAVHRT